MGLHSASDVTHQKRAEDLGKFSKSQWVENWTLNETVDFRLLAETFVAGTTRVVGGCRWESQSRKIVPLSLCRKTFKLKGNKKVSYLNREVVTCFPNFEIPMFYVIYVYM